MANEGAKTELVYGGMVLDRLVVRGPRTFSCVRSKGARVSDCAKLHSCQTDELAKVVEWTGSSNPTESEYASWLKSKLPDIRRLLPPITKTCWGRIDGFSG